MQHTRRRGDELVGAVYVAALAEIAEHGMRGASMERIARQAGTGKAALYRRWPNVRALTLDVFLETLAQAVSADAPDTGSLRTDLITSLAEFSAALTGPLGVVLRELISEAAHDAELVTEFQQRYGLPQQAQLLAVLERARERGELPHRPIDPLALEVPASTVLYHLLLTGEAFTAEQVEAVVDRVIMPVLSRP